MLLTGQAGHTVGFDSLYMCYRPDSLLWKGSQGWVLADLLGLIGEVPIDGLALQVPLRGNSGRLQSPPCFGRSLVRESL